METLHTSPERKILDELEASLALDGLAAATQPEHAIDLLLEADSPEEDYSEPVAKFAIRLSKEALSETVELKPQSPPPRGGMPKVEQDTDEHEMGCLKMNCSCGEKHNGKGKTL